METKNILITGVGGFIGYNLLKRITPRHHVIAIDKMDIPMETTVKPDFIVKGDLSNPNTFDLIKERIDVIYHFGSISSIRQYEGNLLPGSVDTLSSFINVMEFARKNQVSSVIYPSSGTVYGNTSSSVERKISPVNIYGAMKYSSELIANLYANYFQTIGLRIFMGYGDGEERKGDFASPVYLFMEKILRDQQPVVWGDGTQSRDLIYIDDIVEILDKCLSIKNENLVFDVGTGHRTNFISIIDQVNEITNKNIKPIFVPRPNNYLETTTADPRFMIELLGRNPINSAAGIRKFYDYLIQLPGRMHAEKGRLS
jgi:nucleoside-diphosphate-sugar epimerase